MKRSWYQCCENRCYRQTLCMIFFVAVFLLLGSHAAWAVDRSDMMKADKTVIMSIGSNQMIVNDDVIKNDAAPLIRDGRTYVPLRALSNIFDAKCIYNGEEQAISIIKNNTVILMTIGERPYTVNGKTMAMDAPPFITDNGRTMVPVRFIANAFGAVIKPIYNEDGAVVDIMLQM